jgi:GT2 family glycosyltransferase/ubiquinone/menaquinone biosynthesis C-methylase UbiE
MRSSTSGRGAECGGELMRTSIVILTYNKLEYTQQCIQSIKEHTPIDSYELIVVDNLSTDGTVNWLKKQKDIISIFNTENLGFPKGCNQGIEIATGENILLLNNDTVVTKNWLDNLNTCLYSNEEIGAVGAVTNFCSYYQTIPVNYKSLEEMQLFASEYNKSNPSLWEERLKLIGYCMLIKRSVIEQIGLMDERFSPGNYEDDDYSLRIRKSGYKVVLCKDTFIHHYGNVSFRENATKESTLKYANLLRTNQEKYKEKWGFVPDDANIIRGELVELIDKPSTEPIRVLEIGCGCGGTLLKLKNGFPNAELYGIEANRDSLGVASMVAKVIDGSSEGILSNFEEDFFDCILLGDNLHEIDQPQQTLAVLRNYLKVNGQILASVPNLLHYTIIRNFIHGSTSKKQLGYFRLNEVEELFGGSGYKNIQISSLTNKYSEDHSFVQRLTEISGLTDSQPYEIYQFLVKANKSEVASPILSIIEKLQSRENDSYILNELNHYDISTIIDIITVHVRSPIQLLNKIAISNFQERNTDYILPYLYRAFDIDQDDPDTLYNLGYVLYSFGEAEKALVYLQSIENRDDEINQFIYEITQVVNEQKLVKNQVKFLLRRIENHIDRDQSISGVLELISSGELAFEEIIRIAGRDLIEKEEVLNLIAISCYQNQLLDHVIPLLQKSFEWNPTNEDTLYNLGFILYDLGEYQDALDFLERIQNKDEEITRAISEIREGLPR